MIIVDQSKNNIVNFDRTINIGIEEKSTLTDETEISAQTDGYTVILGKYKTEERAKEVLHEIVGLYRRCQQVIGERGGVANFIYPPKVYEMPKE